VCPRAEPADRPSREYSRVPHRVPLERCFVCAQNPLIGALLPRRADIVDDCEAKLVELQYLDVPVR
jgi:hypothetical protein